MSDDTFVDAHEIFEKVKRQAEAESRSDPPPQTDAPHEQKAADDWLAAFVKRSQEALAKRAAHKKIEPLPNERELIKALARKDHTEYDRMRSEVAETLGMRVGTLDERVEAIRKEKAAGIEVLPHWKVKPWDTSVDMAELLADIERAFTRYAYLPPGASVALALWTLHAWTMDADDTSPFLVLVSPTKRCGKTTVLIILYYLTPRSELASNISPSALYRYIEDERPTLLIDEADTFVKENEELRGILNSGHTRTGANVIRNAEIGGDHKPRRFSTWAPKAIATIRSMAATLEDRAVVLTLQRKPKTAAVERLRKRDNPEFAVLRQKAARWAADNFDRLVDPDPKVPDVLNDRAADNWRPLLAIADLAGGEWSRRAREAACALSGEGHDNAIGVELLRDIRTAFGESQVMTSADLLAELTADPERPWAEWKHGRPLTQKQLGGPSRSSLSPSTRPDAPTARATARPTSNRPGGPIVLVRMPLRSNLTLSKRPSVLMPMEWAQLAIFEASAEAIRTDRKTPTCPAAMRVWTLGRIEITNLAEREILPRPGRP